MKFPLFALLALAFALSARAADTYDQAAVPTAHMRDRDAIRAANAADQDAVRAARLAQNAAIVAHDLDRIASCWTDNVIIQRGFGLQCIGKDAYLQLFRDDGRGPAMLYQRIPETIEVSPDWPLAFESGHWEGSLNGRVLVSGKYSAQWVKRDGRWLIRGEVYVALIAHGEGKQLKAIP
jgi:ketosteroid isomerase-like protein